MIIKHYDKAIEVQKLEALEKRMPLHHSKRQMIQTDIRKKKAEIAGEKEVAYPLRFLDKDKFLILHNLRIKDENGFFQIDTLILTENYYLILEVKNWQGTVIFDNNGQVIRVRDGEEEGFPSPIPQVQMQKFRFQKWLRQNKFPELQMVAFVVISFSTTILKTISPAINLPEQVIHNNQLYFKIMELENKVYSRRTSRDKLHHLSDKLVVSHSPSSTDILNKYKLNKADLIKGIFCPKCSANPMVRKKQKWHCAVCGAFSQTAHDESILDYRLLMGDTITNRDLREFLLIDSADLARRILIKLDLIKCGNRKDACYRFADKLVQSADKF